MKAIFWPILRHCLTAGWRLGVGHPRNRRITIWGTVVLMLLQCMVLLVRIPAGAIDVAGVLGLSATGLIFAQTLKETVEEFYATPDVLQLRLAPVSPRSAIAAYLAAKWVIRSSWLVLLTSPPLLWLIRYRTPLAAAGYAALPLMSMCAISLAWLIGGELLHRLGRDRAILAVRTLFYLQVGLFAYLPVSRPVIVTAIWGWWAGDRRTVVDGVMVSTMVAALTWVGANLRSAVLLSRHVPTPHDRRVGGTTFKTRGFMVLVRKEWLSVVRSAYIRSHVLAMTVASALALWFIYRSSTSSVMANMAIFLSSKLAWDITRELTQCEEKHIVVFHLSPIPLSRVITAKAAAAVLAASALILIPTLWLVIAYPWRLGLMVGLLGYLSAIFMAVNGAHSKFASLVAANTFGDMITTGIAFMAIAMVAFAADQLLASGAGPFLLFLLLGVLTAVWAARRCRGWSASLQSRRPARSQ